MTASQLETCIRPARSLWWLHPGWVFALLNGGTLGLAMMLSNNAFRLYGAPKYLDAEYFLLGLLGVALFVAGQWLAKATGSVPPPMSVATELRLGRWFYVAGLLAIVGYLVWFGGGALRSASLDQLSQIWDLDAKNAYDTQLFPTTPGVTTCTQFGMAAVLLGLLSGRSRKRPWLRRGLFVALFLLAFVRMVIVTERIALIELVVPATVLSLRLGVLARPHVSRGAMRRLAAAPVAALVAIVVLFGGAEYFRSWRFYQDRFDSFSEFAVWRLAGYYTTAHNNGALSLKERGTWPMPYYTLEQFWRFPLIAGSPISYQALNGFDPEDKHHETLERFGTPELNNQGGLFSPAMDFGWPGYFVYWTLFGFVAGRLHRGFMSGSLAGLVFYPLVFIAMLEVPRLLYLSSVRSFPTLVFLGLLVVMDTRRKRHPARGGPSPPDRNDSEVSAPPLERGAMPV